MLSQYLHRKRRPSDARSGESRVEAEDRLQPRLLSLAIGMIVFSLILLVLVPLVVETRMDRIQANVVEVADSAHLEANEIALSLARQIALLRGFSLERDSTLLLEYRDWRVREDAAKGRMTSLLQRLPPDLRRRMDTVSRRADQWHDAANAVLAAQPEASARAVPPDQLFARREFQALLREEAALQESFSAIKVNALRRVKRAELYGLIASILLASLALLSTALVVWLGRRVRLYAAQAHHRHVELLQANDARTRLMRGFSHDIKNPLGVVLLSAELLDTGVHGQLTQEQREIVQRISRTGQQVRDLLDDLLDLSRAETGQLQVESESVDLGMLVGRAIEENSGRVTAADLSIEFEPPTEPLVVVADPRRVRQILDNLIGNAVKYTPAGGNISVRCRGPLKDPATNHGKVAIDVEDTGAGVPADQLEHVFEEFVRLPGAHRQGGSGIGLTISRHLARLMNGDITLRSEPGHGSVFTLWLPEAARTRLPATAGAAFSAGNA